MGAASMSVRLSSVFTFGPRLGGTASAGSLAHIWITDVEVGNDPVALVEAEEVAHVLVIGDRAGAPHAREPEGVGGELHVLDGGCAGRVVLQGLDLVAP